jgi:hypothetical protein
MTDSIQGPSRGAVEEWFRRKNPHGLTGMLLRCSPLTWEARWLTFVRQNEFLESGHKSDFGRFHREKGANILSARFSTSGHKSGSWMADAGARDIGIVSLCRGASQLSIGFAT